jgi:hypothetical protein
MNEEKVALKLCLNLWACHEDDDPRKPIVPGHWWLGGRATREARPLQGYGFTDRKINKVDHDRSWALLEIFEQFGLVPEGAMFHETREEFLTWWNSEEVTQVLE